MNDCFQPENTRHHPHEMNDNAHYHEYRRQPFLFHEIPKWNYHQIDYKQRINEPSIASIQKSIVYQRFYTPPTAEL